MGIKFDESKYIKNKIKDIFGEFEIYNPEYIEGAYQKIANKIKENSIMINDEDELKIQTNNSVEIMRIMLTELTNIEDENYWNNLDNIELDEKLRLANGDFKKVINSLVDIMIEIGNDLSLDGSRQLEVLNNKLNEMYKSMKANADIDKTLVKLGLDRDKIVKLQEGDKEIIEEFHNNLLKSKRQYNKKKK